MPGGGSGLGGIQWGIAVDSERVYVPVAEIYNPTPGGLHAVDLATGTRAWYSPPETADLREAEPCLQRRAVFRRHDHSGNRVFAVQRRWRAGLLDGGRPRCVWTFDTQQEFPTINGLRAKGGSMNGPAPVIAGGHGLRQLRLRGLRPASRQCFYWRCDP